MSSYSRWPLEPGGHVDASNQIQQTRTNQAASDNSNRARERQHGVFTTKPLYYSFTMAPAQCARRPGIGILAGCVPDASPGMDEGHPLSCGSIVLIPSTLS